MSMEQKTMKAMVLEAPKTFAMRDLPVPEPGPFDLLVKVQYAGVCGSDFAVVNEGKFIPGFPCVIGHEGSGIVAKVGENLKQQFKEGDRVLGLFEGFGLGEPGNFEEYTLIKNVNIAGIAFPIPDHITSLQAVAIEPFCALSAWYARPNPQPGSKIVVSGCGFMGLGLLQELRKIPDLDIVAIDFVPERLELAKKYGANHLCNPSVDGDSVDYVMDLWGDSEYQYNYGSRLSGNADIVYECSGNTKAFTAAIKMVKPKGKVALIGIAKGMAEIDPQWLQLKEVEVLGGVLADPMHAYDDVISGAVDMSELVTHVFPLEEIDKAYEVAQKGEGIKVVIKVDPDAPDCPYNKK